MWDLVIEVNLSLRVVDQISAAIVARQSSVQGGYPPSAILDRT